MSLLLAFQLGLATDTYQLEISHVIEANQEIIPEGSAVK